MERFQDTALGLWLLGIGYGAHYLLYPHWKNHTIRLWLRWPMSVLAWMAMVGLLLPFKDFVLVVQAFVDHPSVGAAFDVAAFASLALALAWFYQNGEYLAYERIKPFMKTSLLFRHSTRVKDDVFAMIEQGEIESLAGSARGKQRLHEPVGTKRVPMDRAKELKELADLRRERMVRAGEVEESSIRDGIAAEITDIMQLYNIDRVPHRLFKQSVRLRIDPGPRVCTLAIVFPNVDTSALRKPEQWFRFRQDLFDVAQVLVQEEWMKRFEGLFDAVELECHQEETDSFGLPKRVAFLSVFIPVDVLTAYRGKVFIATELEKVGTIVWKEGAPQ